MGNDVSQAPPRSVVHHLLGHPIDLAGHIDVAAEMAQHTKELTRIESAIAGKERQLSNASFVERAPAEVIQKERDALAQLKQLQVATETALAALRTAKK